MAYIEKIKVLSVKPQEEPQVIEIPNTLNAIRKVINGKMEISDQLQDRNAYLIYNKAGTTNNQLPNRFIGTNLIYDSFIIVGNDSLKGDFKSLTQKQITKYQEQFNEESVKQTISRLNARLLARKILYKRG